MINIRLPFVFYHSCFMQPFSYFLFLLQLTIYGKCSVNYFSSPLGDNQHSVQKHRDLDSCPESLGRWRTFVDIPSCPGGGQQVIAAFAIIHNAENNFSNCFLWRRLLREAVARHVTWWHLIEAILSYWKSYRLVSFGWTHSASLSHPWRVKPSTFSPGRIACYLSFNENLLYNRL